VKLGVRRRCCGCLTEPRAVSRSGDGPHWPSRTWMRAESARRGPPPRLRGPSTHQARPGLGRISNGTQCIHPLPVRRHGRAPPSTDIMGRMRAVRMRGGNVCSHRAVQVGAFICQSPLQLQTAKSSTVPKHGYEHTETSIAQLLIIINRQGYILSPFQSGMAVRQTRRLGLSFIN
jgi:hypothetical protein